MEPTFQKSFIPKKSLAESSVVSPTRTNFFLLFSIFIFILVGALYAGLSVYKKSLENSVVNMKIDLDRANKRFETDKLAELNLLDRRLNAGTEVLKQHLAISPVFRELQKITLKSVQYTKFTYDLDDLSKNLVDIKMQGKTLDYRTVALQANVFSQNKNFIQPIFSNLSIDDKGYVLFDLEFKVLRSFVDFEQSILADKNNNTNIPQTEIQNPPLNTEGVLNNPGAVLEDLKEVE